MNGQANLAFVPAEILHFILSYLSKPDQKALRRTCRSINTIATGYVFFRLQMSLRKTDIQSFFEISQQPHLCQLVEEIIWNDIPFVGIREFHPSEHDVLLLKQAILPPGASSTQFSWDNYSFGGLIDSMSYRISDACQQYSPGLSTPRMTEKADILDYLTIGKLFLEGFVAALEGMPRLRTFISRPAPLDMVISQAEEDMDGGYPITVGVVSKFPTSRDHAGISFFLNALKMSSRLNIKSLYFKNSSMYPNTSYYYDFTDQYGAFTGLEHIDFCVRNMGDAGDAIHFAWCLRTAKHLRCLKLCFEGRFSEYPEHIEWLIKIYFSKMLLAGAWNHLESLELVDLVIDREDFQKFITSHKASLRRIMLPECSLDDNRWDILLQHLRGLQPPFPLESLSFPAGVLIDGQQPQDHDSRGNDDSDSDFEYSEEEDEEEEEEEESPVLE
ncbi:hypothetical protein MMC10_010907 [Thelotrema lepadinum]|nr:hypothetical protein [Thelotrema lepadinum]